MNFHTLTIEVVRVIIKLRDNTKAQNIIQLNK